MIYTIKNGLRKHLKNGFALVIRKGDSDIKPHYYSFDAGDINQKLRNNVTDLRSRAGLSFFKLNLKG